MSSATTQEAGKKKKKLSPKRLTFCEEYIIDLNATQAAIRAGYSPKCAKTNGNRLLTYADVQEKIAELKEERSKNARKSADEVLQELENIGFSRLGNIVEWNESGIAFLKNSDELSDADMAALESVQIVEEQTGDDKNQRMVLKSKVKLHNKLSALDKLAKHHGICADKVEHTGSVDLQVNITKYDKDKEGQS